MKIPLKAALLILLICSSTTRGHEHNILVERIDLPFTQTLLAVKTTIVELGYQIAKVQRVDKAMNKVDYATDKYRIIHFGQATQNAGLLTKCPALIAWLPLRITLAAEREQTLLITLNPLILEQFCGPEIQFQKWKNDLDLLVNKLN